MTNSLPSFAREWFQQRQLAAQRLEELRLADLRQLSEADAARIFAQLDPLRPYPLRESSGLVQQQLLFQQSRQLHGKM